MHYIAQADLRCFAIFLSLLSKCQAYRHELQLIFFFRINSRRTVQVDGGGMARELVRSHIVSICFGRYFPSSKGELWKWV